MLETLANSGGGRTWKLKQGGHEQYSVANREEP